MLFRLGSLACVLLVCALAVFLHYHTDIPLVPRLHFQSTLRPVSSPQLNMTVTENSRQKLLAAAKDLVAPGKGILAADESVPTIGKRGVAAACRMKTLVSIAPHLKGWFACCGLGINNYASPSFQTLKWQLRKYMHTTKALFTSISVENTEDHRRQWRHLLFTAPGLNQYISGVILHEETLFQQGPNEKPLITHLQDQGIQVGIKVDTGTAALEGSPEETYTKGLSDLAERCHKYVAAGATFAKWRAVIKIDVANGLPSQKAIEQNAHELAQYALVCQQCGLVPIVEPEVLQDGSHSIEDCTRVTEQVLTEVFKALHAQPGLLLEAILLKPNMVTQGNTGPAATQQQVAEVTLAVLEKTVPAEVPGVVFLSGGQSEALATEHLALMNKLPKTKPWVLSFSYGRALQQSALKAWAGQTSNYDAAQGVLLEKAHANSEASKPAA